ncbi:terminase large subunit [Desulfosporosinus meridiei]|uniref:Phage terminase-like protein, large subunit n=1 Tax=Desulfosporosinus meridiei (strain ATCC BAA-275 / DSM 13257 / KCTC 12902 / NCIMB 13706 / S10) TaxID=768704 RepID=J7IWR7_DESMD|nr:terminase TerL endonuclease subunit [Desulfosporosinus meridiei]AFQ46272.1 phage terminase-like protein, large subunit [Desulfosporosinus meridiei DSM 13257]
MAKPKVIAPEYIKSWHDYVDREPKKHCKDIKKLKKLIESLLKNPKVFYDDTDVEAFIDFCKLVKHKEGRWAGQPFELSIEQKYISACIFGFKIYDTELQMTVRYFKEMILFVARKWGKSTFISAIADFLLMADGEPAAQVWCLATMKTQAAIVYEAAKSFLQTSDVLTPKDNPKKHWRTKRDKDNTEMILFPATNSYMKAGSKNSEGQDGLNPHGVVIDELHAIKNRNTYDVFSSAQGARAQPLNVIISTFGFVREGIFDSIFERCKKVLNGKSKERVFPMIFRIDDDDKPEDRKCWIKANPGLGEARPTMSYLEGEYLKALEDPAQMPSFLAKHLNRASSLSMIYFDLPIVDQCAIDMIEDMIQDRYAVGASDISETTDLCASSALVPIQGKLYLFQKYFIARSRIEQNSKADKMAYESFTSTGASDGLNHELLHICEGSMVSRKDVVQWYVDLAETYGVTFWKIGADRWHYEDFASDMEIAGFPRENKEGRGVVFSVAMGAKSLSQPMKETRSLFEDKVVQFSRHNGLFRWCTTNTAAKIDTNANIQPDKAKSKARIDGYMSYLMAYIAYKKVQDLFEEYQS